jgi:zinc protease
MLKNSRYAERLPIGDMDVVKNAPCDELRKFYRDWYRPNLMAVAVVGDINTPEAESKIKQHFENMENPENAPERIEYDIPGNTEPLIAIVTDKEATDSDVQLIIKHPKVVAKNIGDYRNVLIRQFYNGMINKRLNELSQEPDAPFLYAETGYSGFIGTVDAYSSFALAKENEIQEALKLILLENERVKKFGFTQTELEREKLDIMTRYEQAAKEADKIESASLIDEYMEHFLNKEPIPGIINENEYVKQFIPGITVDEVNQLAEKWITDDNVCVIILAPEKEGITLPSDGEILELLKTVREMSVTEYVDQVVDAPLLTEEPEGSRVFRRKDNPDFGYVELTFLNGVQVILKPTDFKNDQILFSGYSPGGTSLYLDEDYMSAIMAGSIVSMSGLGNFDQIALNKKLTGNTAKLSPYIGEIYEGVSGSSAPKDLETLLQLNYMYFTAVRRDEKAFNTLISQLRNQVANMSANPLYAYMDTLYKTVSSNDPRTVIIPTGEQIDMIRLDNALYIFNDRFADAGDFKFFIIGNFKVNSIIPLLEKYLGGLPAKKRVESWRNVTPQFPAGVTVLDYDRNSEEQSRINIMMKGNFKWDYKERLQFAIMTEILNIKLRESMREDQGGVYGVQLSGDASLYPEARYAIDIVWGCSPQNADALVATVFDEAKKLKTGGPEPADLNKVKEIMIRERESLMKENSYWQQVLQNVYKRGDKLVSLEEYTKFIRSVKPKHISNLTRKYFNENNYVLGKLMPAKE